MDAAKTAATFALGMLKKAKRKVKSGKYDALSRIEHRDYWSYD